MLHESPINLFTAVCLYRSNAGAPFSESDRRFKEGVVPHLVQAWHINAIRVMDPPAPVRGVSRARALVDRLGVIHNAESGFAALMDLAAPARARAPIDGLSRRELLVAREFASGKNYKEIAKQLGTSPTTVRSQLQVAYTKLGVRRKVDLVKAVESSLGRLMP